MNLDNIKIIAFDADDTLWVNEPYFRKAEQDFCDLLKDFMPEATCNKILFEVEMQNLPTYGYGIKPFALSLIEAAIKISENKIPVETISKIINIAKEMLNMPIELIDGIEQTLQQLSKKYKLVMATKGDLLDQERKLIKSGLEKYFHHIEVMSDKKPKHYQKLIKHLDSNPEEFLMIGNSLKSDILPVLETGASAIYIPFHTTWEHEKVDDEVVHSKFKELKEASELLNIL
ncbi:MAG: HAD family hydrolase [Flavobacteriaceae bacterium]|nr:HAD family hydrolase [Flavobacteriaceae bacterium]